MISDRYKCIFIHIPKTAGTSIEKKLGKFEELERGVQDHRTISEIEPINIFELTKLCLRSDTISIIYQTKKLIKDSRTKLKKKYNEYYKFSFVRNPWARVFSWYRNVMRDEEHKKRYKVKDNCSFEEFLKYHMDQRQVNTQLFWLIDKRGNMPFDFIGRFENINKDFSFVANRIGLEDAELPRLIAGDGRQYTQYYDSVMKDFIYNKYKAEIKLFNYEYGE